MNLTSLIFPQEINSPKEVKFSDNRSEKDKQNFNSHSINSILNNLEEEYKDSQTNTADSNGSYAVVTSSFTGAVAGDKYGFSVSGAGDVNGDGFDDIIIGAPYNDAAGTDAGAAYIYFGDAVVNTVADVTLTGEAAGDNFGISVSSSGDINDDGYYDVIIGASGFSGNKGRAYIFLGGISMDNSADVILTGEFSGNLFGNSVSAAGNVNGDSYSDVVVGAKSYSSSTGRAYLFYGGAAMNNSADIILNGESSLDNFGTSVSSAEDFNGDGYDDIIIGAPGNSGSKGKAYIFTSGINMDNIADITMSGEGTNNFFGCSVNSAGDINSDGFSDVIAGASGYSTNTGRAYIFMGGLIMNNTSDITMTGIQINNHFGCSVSKANDINGDGYSDVLVGAYKQNSDTGRAFIFYGGVSMNNIADINLKGEASGNYFGQFVGYAGDINGDGYSDVIAGAPGFSSAAGKVYLYMYGMTGTLIPDLTMSGEGNFSNLGFSVSSAGDVNRDGFSDVIVGAYVYNQTFTGRAYIYYGGMNMDNIADVVFNGEDINNYFGYSVSAAGDVNDDGFSDIVIGAYGYANNVGRAYVFYGGTSMNNAADVIMAGTFQSVNFGISVSSAGDLNGDGYSDVIVGSNNITSGTGRAYIYYGGASMNNLADVTLIGEGTGNLFGTSVATAGDVNNDGYSDVIVGANGYSTNTGRAYIFFGAVSMNPVADVIMTGDNTNNHFGYSVSTAADINKDGYSDVIIGAYGNNTSTGKANIYFGGLSMDNISDVTLTGEATNNYFSRSVAAAGDINQDGYSDVIIGADGFSSFKGKSYIYFGGANMNTVIDISIIGEVNNSLFGKSVSSAGDVNGDGNRDIITGASNINTSAGRSYLYMTTTPNMNPNLLFVKDVPDDQGGFVNLKFTKSAYDISVNGLVTGYLIERSIPPVINVYQWISAGNITASQIPVYNFHAATPSDSGITGSNLYYFRVTALTSNQNQYWISNIVSGYSVANSNTGFIKLKILIEGFYNIQSNNMNLSDTAKVFLRNASSPYSIADSSTTVIGATTFTGIFQIGNALSGNYYLEIKQRNTIETWSSSPVNYLQNDTIDFDFTTSSSQAFGNNMVQVNSNPDRFAIYSGDVNQDGAVDLTDGTLIENDAFNFVSGYVSTDLNGDNFADLADLSIADNNAFNFVSVEKP